MVISGCENKAAVMSNSTNDVYGIGGIVGYNSGHKVAMTNCINSGAITGTHETAGIIGYSDHSDISGCTNSGAVSGFATVGGIVGKMGGGSIVSCKIQLPSKHRKREILTVTAISTAHISAVLQVG